MQTDWCTYLIFDVMDSLAFGYFFSMLSSPINHYIPSFCAFSLGPRECIGRNMAYGEMMLAIARVLSLFEVEMVGDVGGERGGTGSGC